MRIIKINGRRVELYENSQKDLETKISPEDFSSFYDGLFNLPESIEYENSKKILARSTEVMNYIEESGSFGFEELANIRLVNSSLKKNCKLLDILSKKAMKEYIGAGHQYDIDISNKDFQSMIDFCIESSVVAPNIDGYYAVDYIVSEGLSMNITAYIDITSFDELP